MDDLSAAATAALAPARPGGLMPVIPTNRHSERLRLATFNDLVGRKA